MNIDWNKVIPGKTVLEWDEGYGIQGLVLHVIHVFGDSVWVVCPPSTIPQTFHKFSFTHCHIKDQWREITEECGLRVDNRGGGLHWLCLSYQNNYISFDECHGQHPKFKIEWPKVFIREGR